MGPGTDKILDVRGNGGPEEFLTQRRLCRLNYKMATRVGMLDYA